MPTLYLISTFSSFNFNSHTLFGKALYEAFKGGAAVPTSGVVTAEVSLALTEQFLIFIFFVSQEFY
jgi:hypothetical protein